jgi:16S rRNA (uracil1498-N3)-methyltransferase
VPSSRDLPGTLRESAAHAFVADVGQPELRDEDRHHLERVLRLRVGETVTVSDGRGSWRACAFRVGAALEAVGEVCMEARPEPLVTVGFALVKGDRPEWAVQKLVEVGVDVIVPFTAARSVVRWDEEKAARNRDRLARVAVEAAMQSRRVWLPEVREISGLAEAMVAAGAGAGAAGAAGARAAGADAGAAGAASAASAGAARADANAAGADAGIRAAGARAAGAGAVGADANADAVGARAGHRARSGPLALAEPGGEPLSLAFPTVFVGPEGGWSPEELALDAGRVSLGSTILRAETATMAVAVLLCALRGKSVQSHEA